MASTQTPPLWCIVQADGDKACLTTRGAVPVQYCRLGDSQPLIQQVVQRALRITSPRHVVATVADTHRHWWVGPLWCIPAQRRIVDESTGRMTVTLAAALALIERSTPDAVVVIQPTDAIRLNEQAFVAGVGRAVAALERLPIHMIALTLEPVTVEPGQDYFLLGPQDGLPGRAAVRLVKHPQAMIADRLVATGALLGTGVYVARLSTIARILEEAWPGLVAAARALSPVGSGEIRTPSRMAGSQFSRPWRHTWVQRPIPRLRALGVDSYGWVAAGPAARLRSTAWSDATRGAADSPPIRGITAPESPAHAGLYGDHPQQR